MCSWQPPQIAQSLTGTVVFGDVFQIAGVGGNVTISAIRPPYRVESFSAGPDQLSVEKARAQPSRLLLPRYRVVPFTGREPELEDLRLWLGSADGVLARLVHAQGGQGKTRLAAQVADQSVAAGWVAWRVMEAPQTGAPSQAEIAGQRGVLAIVDYADRWPNSHLLALMADMRALNLRTGIAVRVLLLARSSSFWWPALADHIDRDLEIDCSTTGLGPITGAGDRDGLFCTAATAFATAMALDCAVEQLHRPDLKGSDFARTLSVHMAALVALLARDGGGGIDLNGEPALSAFLLRREYAHWQVLHEEHNKITPQLMARACYVATLAGTVPRNQGRRLLEKVALAANVPDADRLIDEHRVSYPSSDPTLVLEALQPDRLGEDFVALSTPGHDLTQMWPTDDWTIDAATTLIDDSHQATPAEARSSLTFLVEASRRWPHLAVTLLSPMIREHPSLALAAGGNTLIRLVGIPGIDWDVLEAIDTVLPPYGHIEFDAAAAEIASALNPHRLNATNDPWEHAQHNTRLAQRLYRAGRPQPAAAAALQAAANYRELNIAEGDVTRLGALASSQSDLGAMLVGDPQRLTDGLQALEESTQMLRGLARIDPDSNLPRLAASLANLSLAQYAGGDLDEAIRSAEEAVVTDTGTMAPTARASALINLSGLYSQAGRHGDALRVAQETVVVVRPAAETTQRAPYPRWSRARAIWPAA